MSPAPVCMRVTVRGRVQGVYFRAWTEARARELELSGWVQNMPDGSVLAQFAGAPEAVAEMVAACREGPRDAKVEDIRVERLRDVPPLEGFRINR